ncbi:hypothetical protein [Novosphingobium panipatense]|uniref:Uncharacterized protein n=1 Tax=Novosphingobium panipatense TaxID=428991 RepID=A0ABY1QI78_9SPHN|nr:hypothetical protein [Novosphingobium panipatense]SMP72217.1 hypothetical protein SAMN06296065_106155 [Novosphingobium panipatense]
MSDAACKAVESPLPEQQHRIVGQGAIQNFTGGLAQLLGVKKIRVNCGAPRLVWTPLLPPTLSPDQVEEFGKNAPFGRPGQLKEPAAAKPLI